MENRRADEVWKAALGELELQVTKPYYETYLRDTTGLKLDGEQFTIGVPNAFGVEWLRLRMRSRIEEVLSGLIRSAITAHFTVRRDDQGTTLVPSRGVPAYDVAEPDSDEPPGQDIQAPCLNGKYTFGNLVVGRFNQMAHAAARSVAENPGQRYNPLFLYSGFGLGKTHLLQAIGHMALAARCEVLYVSAEQFTNDLVEAGRDRSYQQFREKYRSVDLLLVDDIQFISGKQQTQEGFYHTFNYLHNANKQIVMAGDCHPSQLPVMDPRLVSRFEGGLMADISPPCLENRVEILRAKAAQQEAHVPEDVLELIARQTSGSIRKLEGAINRVIVFAIAAGADLTLAIAAEALATAPSDTNRNLTSDTIIERTATYFDLSSVDLKGKGRQKKLVMARDITIFLLREELRLSPMRIGALLGDRTPTGVSISCRKVAGRLTTNEVLRSDLSLIRDSIYSRASAI